MSQRRITFIISSLGAGGAERVMTKIANAWAEKGWDITLLTFCGSEVKPFYSLNSAITLYPLTIAKPSKNIVQGLWNNVRRLQILRRAVISSRPDAVISFMDRTNVVTLLAMRFTGIPVIVSDRCAPIGSFESSTWKRLRHLMYRYAQHIVIQTDRMREYMPVAIHEKCRVIPNPVSKLNLIEEKPLLTFETPFIAAMGRLCEQKGFDLLIKAFSKIAPQFKELKLVILGEGEQRGKLERLCNERFMTGRILFLGQINNPQSVIKKAEVFILSSRFEGFPNALCEAMACGVPVIATDCPAGPREIIREGVDGLLVTSEDVNALATAMESLLSNASLRKRMGQNALDVTERFHPDRIMQMWENLLP